MFGLGARMEFFLVYYCWGGSFSRHCEEFLFTYLPNRLLIISSPLKSQMHCFKELAVDNDGALLQIEFSATTYETFRTVYI